MNDTTQNKSHPATTIEFFREKFADEDNEEGTEPVWIDPKGDLDEPGKHHFVAGQIGAGKSTRLVGLLDGEQVGSRADSAGGDE